MIDLDFLEIGTSDFDTLIEKATDDSIGISVEPMKIYLDKLPSPKNVKKINCAISLDNVETDVNLYFISPENIKKYNLPKWYKGCNSINDYHKKIKEHKLEHLCSIITVKQIPISKLLEEEKVRKIDFLKIDTEGYDCYILLNLLDYLKNKEIIYYPRKIKFESNRLTTKQLVLEVIESYKKVGYKLDYSNKKNTQLFKHDI